MLKKKLITEIEKNIMEHKDYKITNDEFLRTIFGEYTDDQHAVLICSRENLKSSWGSHPWKKGRTRFSRSEDNYFTVSLFKPNEEGRYTRNAELVTATCCIVLDDYTVKSCISKKQTKNKTQLPFENLPLEPTWVIRTSKGNAQVGFIMSAPIKDRSTIDQIYKVLNKKGFTDGGAESNKYMRLPNGRNSKYNEDNSCFLAYWNPSAVYELEEFLNAFGINEHVTISVPIKKNNFPQGTAVYTPCPPEGFVIQKLREKGLNASRAKDGSYDIDCPWHRDHTNGDKKAKLYLPDEKNLIGGFKCLHNHCQGKEMRDVLEFLRLSEVDAQGRDEIKLINQRSDLINDAITKSLSRDNSIYSYNNQIVQLKRNKGVFQTEILLPSTVKSVLSKIAVFLTMNSKNQWEERKVDNTLIQDYLSCQNLRGLPELTGIIHHPVILPNGRFLNSKGWDESTGLFCTQRLKDPLAIKIEKATRDDALRSLSQLKKILMDFLFVDEEDLSAALFALLTAVERPVLRTATLFLVTANGYGAGKTCLCNAITAFTGPWEKPITQAMASQKDYFQKAMISYLLKCPPYIHFDNVLRDIYSNELLASMLTAEKIEDRKLGTNQIVTVNTNTFLIMNGNKINVYKDLIRRTTQIRLDKGTGNRQFQYPNLLEYINRKKATLTAHVLTIIKAFLNAEVKETFGERRLSSFEDQDFLCRQPLLWLDQKDPASRTFSSQDNDPEKLAFKTLLREFWLAFRNEAFTTSDLLTQLRKDQRPVEEWISLFSAIGIESYDEDNRLRINTSQLGKYLSKQFGDHEGGYTLNKKGYKHNQAAYSVSKTNTNKS